MSDSPLQPHALLGKWSMYYHLPYDKNWDLSSYKLVSGEIDTVEKVISLASAITDPMARHSMLFVMRNGITPTWEDPKNRTGGAFSFKVANRQVPAVWRDLFFSLCGETILTDRSLKDFVNGITVSPKKNFCIVKIWMSSCDIQDPSRLTHINMLSKQGCLFKKHEPEY